MNLIRSKLFYKHAKGKHLRQMSHLCCQTYSHISPFNKILLKLLVKILSKLKLLPFQLGVCIYQNPNPFDRKSVDRSDKKRTKNCQKGLKSNRLKYKTCFQIHFRSDWIAFFTKFLVGIRQNSSRRYFLIEMLTANFMFMIMIFDS
jgi:hypothetical protein